MGEKYTSLDRIKTIVKITMKEQANNKQKSGKRKEKREGYLIQLYIYKINNHRRIYTYCKRDIRQNLA